MTAGESYANPLDFDMTAASGSTVFDFPNPSAPPWAYYASSNTSTSYFPPTAAMDGNTGTCWETNGLDVGNTWFALQAGDGSPITLTTYTLTPRQYWQGRMPTDWTFEGSDDGVTWTVVDTQSGVTNWDGTPTPQTFTLAAPVTNKYFRINVTALNGDWLCNLGEIYLNNQPNPATGSSIYFYVRLRGLPDCRIYSPTFTPGTASLVNEWSAWTTWVEAEPENTGDTTGYYNLYNPTQSTFTTFGNYNNGGIILRFKLQGYGNFTWDWTSVDVTPPRPYSWFDATMWLDASAGVQDYQDWGNHDPLYGKLFYRMVPQTTDVITITTNQPNAYFEVYQETGLRSYDDYIQDGYTLSDGTVDPNGGDCVFTPIAGQQYVVVIYTNNPDLLPDGTLDPNRPTWRMTWETSIVIPPAYVVANDDFGHAINIDLTGNSGSFTYDNTGATQGDAYYDGPRSIWYTFTPTQTRYLNFRATPGNPAAKMPSLNVLDATGGYIAWESNGQVPYPGGYTLKVVAGTTYRLLMTWQSAVATTPWDFNGFCSYAFYDIPNDTVETSTVLIPGTSDQQNVPAAGPISGYRGAGLWFKITMPTDGALCIIIEVPDGQIAAHADYYNYFNGALYREGTYTDRYGNTYPKRYLGALPVQEPSNQKRPLVRAAKAGDVFDVYVMAPVDGALLRWGVATDVEWGVWHSADWNAVNGSPLALTAWPGVSGTSKVAGTVGWSGSAHDELANSGRWPLLDCSRFPTVLEAASGGDSNPSGPSFGGGGSYGVGVATSYSASGIVDPNGDKENWDASYSTTVGGQKVLIYGTTDPAGQGAYNWLDITNPYGEAQFQPISGPAYRGAVMLDPNYLAQSPVRYTGDQINEIGQWLLEQGVTLNSWQYVFAQESQQFAVEWSAENPTNAPRFNVYRGAWASWHKQVSGSMGPTYYCEGFGFECHLVERTNDIPQLDGLTPSWVFPSIGGVSVDSFTGSADDVGSGTYNAYGDAPNDYSSWYNTYLDHNQILEDVTAGQWPDQTWSYTEVWGCEIVNAPWGLPVQDMSDKLAALSPDYGGFYGSAYWPNGNFGVSWNVDMGIGRKYPDQYRVGRYTPVLMPLDTNVPTPAGPLTDMMQLVSTDVGNGEYVYEGAVGVGTPAPILWFVWKRWSFLGNHILAYGQGLGDSQSALNGVLKLGDYTPTIVGWQLDAATNHAYDGTGVIYPGTDVTPPRVDVEVQVIEFIVPDTIPLSVPTAYPVYVTNDNGTSNELPLMLYPIVDVSMGATAPELTSMSRAMGVWDMAETAPMMLTAGAAPSSSLEQRFSRIPVSYVLTSGIPEQAPEFLTNALPACTLTVGAPSSGLDDPANVSLPLNLRYRPLDSQIVPRPDLGSSISAWQPLSGSSFSWSFDTATGPYVDATTQLDSRSGELVRPALVFPGTAWAQLTNGFASGPQLTLAMAVTLFPDTQPRSYILSSFADTPLGAGDAALEAYLEGDQLTVAFGGTVQTAKIAPGYIGKRPIILAITMDQTSIRTAIVSDRAMVALSGHPETTTSGVKLYLGRSSTTDLRSASMDIFDMAIDTSSVPEAQLWQVINRLDGVYGVTK